MYLRHFSLVNFKNHRELRIELSPQINIFTGNNGTGKTNLLDAVYYLCFCRSFLNPVDRQLVNQGEKFFVLNGDFEREGQRFEIHCAYQPEQRKKFKKNQKEYERLSDHIGEFPAVVISPYDTDLIVEGSDTRRKFLDTIICQYDRPFLEKLIRYNKILQQRNALLKKFRDERFFERESLEIWDLQLIEFGNYIHQKRDAFVREFIPVFQQYYERVSNGNENIDVLYESQLNGADFSALLANANRKDSYAGYSTVGIHKDDLIFSIDQRPVKKFGSQGQQKSFLIGLRLAQFDLIAKKLGRLPILLLDDIFDKLDQERVEQIMKLLSGGTFGQVLITDTDADRVEKVFREIDIPRRHVNLNELNEVKTT